MGLELDPLLRSRIDPLWKGVPSLDEALCIADLPQKGWSVLREEVPLPVAVLRESSLANNSRWMKTFLSDHGCVICPHGKTTMAPQLFQRQLEDGAWGITAATPTHVKVYRRFGVSRILLANQLIDPHGAEFIFAELRRDPNFDFYCLVDSLATVEWLDQAAARFKAGRRVQVLIEFGARGGRTGARTAEEWFVIAENVASSSHLALRGIEAYEAVFSIEQSAELIPELLKQVKVLASRARDKQLFAPGSIIVSAGGSQYVDIVARELRECTGDSMMVVLRSGCYLTHDDGVYERSFERLRARSAGSTSAPPLVAALEVWGRVQSSPEPGKAIANFGKRDVSYDMGLPLPLWWFRPGTHAGPQSVRGRCQITKLNDQHAHLALDESFDLQVGDMIGVGISHPCTTFDKWQLLYLVDDLYNITGGIRTFF